MATQCQHQKFFAAEDLPRRCLMGYAHDGECDFEPKVRAAVEYGPYRSEPDTSVPASIAKLKRTVETAAEALGPERFNDEELRAECERRHIVIGVDPPSKVMRERDEWKRRADDATTALFQMQEAAKDLAGRVESSPIVGRSEVQVVRFDPPAVVVPNSSLTPEEQRRLRDGGSPRIFYTTDSTATFPALLDGSYIVPDDLVARVKVENGGRIPTAGESMRKMMLATETDPVGIAAKAYAPDTSLDVDPLDLLADDAP